MIVAGIATIPARVESLQKVLNSLTNQVDLMIVTLNGHTFVPDYFEDYDNLEYRFADNTRGDAEKFVYAERIADCYYLGCDDDIIYNPAFANYMIDKCVKYDCPVSLAGKRFKFPVQSYHRSAIEFHHCLREVSGDYDVDVIGTGVLCFRTGQLRISMDDFKSPNMADLWFSMAAVKAGIPLKVISHPTNYLTYLPQKWTIWGNKPKTGEENKVINDLLRIKYKCELE